MTYSRRAFLGGAASLAFCARAGRAATRPGLREFAYSRVKLTGGPLAAMHKRIHEHYLSLDEDRLLKVYRQRVGMPAPGRDMGGWYDAGGFVPGHLLGQVISGLARLYANTADANAAAKARRLVEGYGATFEKDHDPYASSNASTWACYILDKYEIGLLDAATLAGIDQARNLLPRVIEAAVPVIPDHTFDRIGTQKPPYDEPYILSENLFKSYELTGDKRFLEMADRYLLNEFFDPLAEGKNVLPGKHGYSHVMALSSAGKAYEVSGDPKYLRAMRNAWEMLEHSQQYASGAWAPGETFVKPDTGELAASLAATHDHFETPCCFYANAKLARYLMCFTGESRYGDGLERVLLNTILGALDPDDDGGYFYYSDYHAQARKGYYKRKWPCCAGTLLQSVADYPLDLYFHDAGGIYVNLYAASEVAWQTRGTAVRLAQQTEYPESERIEVRVEPERPADFAVHLRIPGWLDGPAHLEINGKSVEAARGTFATIRRRWRRGDAIELTLPFSFRAAPIDEQNRSTFAVMRGPVMLTAVNPPAELIPGSDILSGMTPVSGSPLEFDCRTASGRVRLRPFYRVQREPYTTYFHGATRA